MGKSEMKKQKQSDAGLHAKGLLGITSNHKKLAEVWNDSLPSEPPQRTNPVDSLILDFWLPEL